jgi:two-component system, response regulator YesN
VTTSVRDYLLNVRLRQAKALLASGHVSVTEVAQIVGFADLPSFDKLFKRHTGLTPSRVPFFGPSESNK